MTRIDVGEEGDGAQGLLALVVAVVEILIETMEQEAIRRMDSGDLTDEEVERLGGHLASLDAELDRLKDEMDVEEPVDDLRGDLDGLVGDALSAARAGGVSIGEWPNVSPSNQPNASNSNAPTTNRSATDPSTTNAPVSNGSEPERPAEPPGEADR